MLRQSLTRVSEVAAPALAALFCLLLIVLAARSAMSNLELMRDGIRATGVVIARKDDSMSDIDSWALVVRFEIAPGQFAVTTVSAGSAGAKIWEGAEVEIIYAPGKPKKAHLFPLGWGLPIGLLILSLPMLLVSGGTVYLILRTPRHSEPRDPRGPNQLD